MWEHAREGGGGRKWTIPGLTVRCTNSTGPQKEGGEGSYKPRGRLRTACGQRRVDGNNSQTTPATTSTAPNTPTTGRRERGNDTSRSTGRSG